MKCADCRQNILSQLVYYCPCNPSAIFCFSCRDNQCYKCWQNLKSLQKEVCNICWKSNYEFLNFCYEKKVYFCYQCILKLYTEKKENKIYLKDGRRYLEDRFNLFQFLRCFCWTCKKKIHASPSDIQGVKEITELKFNLCEDCSSISQRLANAQTPKVPSRQPKQKMEQITPQTQNRSFKKLSENLHCTVCGHFAWRDPIIKDGCIICKFCAEFSLMEESKLVHSDSVSKSTDKYREDMWQPLQRKISDQISDDEYSSKNSYSPSKSIQNEKQSLRSNQTSIKDESTMAPELQLKKNDSQEQLTNIVLECILKNGSDNELIQCNECGYEVQGIYSIWIDNNEEVKSICRGCYIVANNLMSPTAEYLSYIRQESPKRQKYILKEEAELKNSKISPDHSPIFEDKQNHRQKQQLRGAEIEDEKLKAKSPISEGKQNKNILVEDEKTKAKLHSQPKAMKKAHLVREVTDQPQIIEDEQYGKIKKNLVDNYVTLFPESKSSGKEGQKSSSTSKDNEKDRKQVKKKQENSFESPTKTQDSSPNIAEFKESQINIQKLRQRAHQKIEEQAERTKASAEKQRNSLNRQANSELHQSRTFSSRKYEQFSNNKQSSSLSDAFAESSERWLENSRKKIISQLRGHHLDSGTETCSICRLKSDKQLAQIQNKKICYNCLYFLNQIKSR